MMREMQFKGDSTMPNETLHMKNFQEKIKAVENNLLPAIFLQGTSPTPGNLMERLAHYQAPGVSIAVINDQAIEWAQGYGVLQAGNATLVTPQTLFQAASISKPVAAMAALHLVQSGQLDLDSDVNQVLRSWKVPENEHTRASPVTLRGLLAHSAGLTVSGFMGYAAGEDVPTLRQVLDGEGPANSDPIRVDVVPGSQFRYSGGGYTVMQQLLVDVTGQPFPQLMQEIVLDEIGMRHSTFEQPLPQAYTAQAASGHRPCAKPMVGQWHTYPEMAAAGLWTTPSDLARFAIELLRSRVGQSNQVLSADMARLMLTLQVADFYGLGLELKDLNGSTRFSHPGWNEGYRGFMFAYTGSGQGAVVMTNVDDGQDLALEIVRGIARVYDWPDFHLQEKALAHVAPGIYDAYAGQYQYVDYPDYGILVTRQGERLFMRGLPEGRSVELWPESETHYFVVESGAGMTFLRDAAGEVHEVEMGEGEKLKRSGVV
jgi:CubicO group peptidase (beta-lactamase class C family)